MTNDLDREEELWHGGYSGKDMAGTWLVAAILTIVAIAGAIVLGSVASIAFLATAPFWIGFVAVLVVIWLVLIGRLFARKLSIDYRLTSQRLVRKTGLLTRKTGRVEVIDIDDISYEQGIVQRLLGVGRVKVLSSDVSDPTMVMLGISNPSEVADLIDKARRAERVKRGVHVERV